MRIGDLVPLERPLEHLLEAPTVDLGLLGCPLGVSWGAFWVPWAHLCLLVRGGCQHALGEPLDGPRACLTAKKRWKHDVHKKQQKFMKRFLRSVIPILLS